MTEQEVLEMKKKLQEYESELTKKDDDTVVIKGNKFFYWYYSNVHKFFQKIAEKYGNKALKNREKHFKLKKFEIQNPRLIYVSFVNLLTNNEYEVYLHHETAYRKYYEEYSKTGQIPKLVKISEFIKSNYKTAVKL